MEQQVDEPIVERKVDVPIVERKVDEPIVEHELMQVFLLFSPGLIECLFLQCLLAINWSDKNGR